MPAPKKRPKRGGCNCKKPNAMTGDGVKIDAAINAIKTAGSYALKNRKKIGEIVETVAGVAGSLSSNKDLKNAFAVSGSVGKLLKGSGRGRGSTGELARPYSEVSPFNMPSSIGASGRLKF